jgi:mycothiol synthase
MEQLRMIRPHLRDLPTVALVEGYALRTYQAGDEQAWGDIMNTGIGSEWTVEKVRQDLTQQPQFLADGLFFVTHAGQPVGSACAWRVPPEEMRQGYVHMVCVLPEHRGRELGYAVTLAVLHWFRQQGFESAVLQTDDWRLAAIKAYLRLGFEPEILNDEMRQRWVAVAHAIRREDLAQRWGAAG